MLAPTAGSWSYLAWINACAWAAVSSGADLQPLNNKPVPNIAATARTLKALTFFTFPPYTARNDSISFDPPFLSYFRLLSMELKVTLRTSAGLPPQKVHF
jgi:hypothetical protein